jgi:hypothetical protein
VRKDPEHRAAPAAGRRVGEQRAAPPVVQRHLPKEQGQNRRPADGAGAKHSKMMVG